MTITETVERNKERIALVFGVPAHLLADADRAAVPRIWSLCMTSENHGTVGPAGCTFSHAPDKHERVLVVEVPAAAGAPVDQVNLQLVGARRRRPVAEFKGYVDGQPAVTWFDRDNMPRVGTKLFASAAPASTVLTDDEDLLDVVRTLCAVAARRGELVPERLKHYPHVDEEGSPVLVAARAACVARGYTEDGLSVEGVIYPVAAQAGQVAVPEGLADKIKAAMKESQVGHNYDGNKLVWKLEELLAAPSPAKEST